MMTTRTSTWRGCTAERAEQAVAELLDNVPVNAGSTVESALPCREDPDLWFSETPAELERAKSFCAECPIKAECLAGARSRGEPWGVWGGEIFERGAVVARKRPRGRPRKHPVAEGSGQTAGTVRERAA